MNENQELLEVVDENDIVIGLETRTKIHNQELFHRDVHIWFFTPDGKMIFQHRSKDKDFFPDMLDATVSGHVEANASYEETALKECKEETGINIDSNKLLFMTKTKNVALNKTTNTFHNTIGVHYAYLYIGSINDLQIEKGKSQGFEAWSIDNLNQLSEENKSRFIDPILDEELLELFNKARKTFSV